MIPIEAALAFFVVAVLLGLAPGPDNVFVLLQSAMRGRTAGMQVVLGLCTGLLGHTAAVAGGLAALFAASATAFEVVKWFGALYLAWLAWQAFRAPAGIGGATAAAKGGGWAMYRRGVLMNLSNPKVAIFFLAFLPQFTDPSRGAVWAQVMILGAIFIFATLLVFGGIAWFAGVAGERLRTSPRLHLVLNRIAGTVFVLLALRLALAER